MCISNTSIWFTYNLSHKTPVIIRKELVGGFNPSEKYHYIYTQMDYLSKDGGEHKNIIETTT